MASLKSIDETRRLLFRCPLKGWKMYASVRFFLPVGMGYVVRDGI